MIACRRGDFPGATERLDRNGVPQWLGFLDGQRPEAFGIKSLPSPSSRIGRLAPAVLHRIYSQLLEDLTLSAADWKNLEHVRGFSREAVRRHGFKSFAYDDFGLILDRLVAEFSRILDAPGFYEKNGRVRFAAWPGLLIPCRDTEGRIMSLRLRPYKPGKGGKYRWVSSPDGGPGPTLLASCWRPAVVTEPGVIRIAEGELCAARLAEASGIITLSAGSVVSMASLEILDMLRALEPSQIVLCPDANWRTNTSVAGAVARALATLESFDIPLSVEVWGDDVA